MREPEGVTTDPEELQEEEKDKKKRRWLLLLLMLLLLLLACVCWLAFRYARQPEPLPEMLPVDVNYPPHYLFSIYGVDRPVGVAVSPDGERIYVAETGGERLVKIFDREGNPLGSFAPPHTTPAQRSPVYLATDHLGRVFVADRLQNVVFVYDEDGVFLDAILGPELSLSEYVAEQVDGFQPEDMFVFNWFEGVYYRPASPEEELAEAAETAGPEEGARLLPIVDIAKWGPLGVRFDGEGRLLLTNTSGDHYVCVVPVEALGATPWRDFNPIPVIFGTAGQGDGQFLFPNTAVIDSQGRFFVTDGNNGRVTVWDREGNFLFYFGRGTGEGAISLPRGAYVDERDRLYVVDAVSQQVKVYDVSGEEVGFLFAFGEWGLDDGQFNYPNDIALDETGRLYIADRENSRIQVWSY
jgi:DNA-binding beta-propeller fold protein YncE